MSLPDALVMPVRLLAGRETTAQRAAWPDARGLVEFASAQPAAEEVVAHGRRFGVPDAGFRYQSWVCGGSPYSYDGNVPAMIGNARSYKKSQVSRAEVITAIGRFHIDHKIKHVTAALDEIEDYTGDILLGG